MFKLTARPSLLLSIAIGSVDQKIIGGATMAEAILTVINQSVILQINQELASI